LEGYPYLLADIELSERKGAVIVRQGKGGKRRRVPLNSEARKALTAYLKLRAREVRPEWPGAERLFWGQRGPIGPRAIQRVVACAGQQAGLPHLTPHVLRHTFGKALVDQGVSLDRVATLMGHSNLNVTRRYTTPSERDLEQAVELLSAE